MTPAERIERVAAWLDREAAADEERAKDRRFPSLASACAHDARNRRIAARDLREALAALLPPEE